MSNPKSNRKSNTKSNTKSKAGSNAETSPKRSPETTGSSSDAEASAAPVRRTTPLQDLQRALKTITGEQKRIAKELQKTGTNAELREIQEKHLEGLNTLQGRLEEQMTQIRSKQPKRKGTPTKRTKATKKGIR